MLSQVRLRLWPTARCLFDEPIQVKVDRLRSKQVVTVKATSTDDKGVLFNSSAVYQADESGEIHLSRDPSLSGSYVGVEPMGLLWSLRPETLHKHYTKTKALSPLVVKMSVHEEGEGRMLAEVTNERFLMADGVSRVPVTDGNIRGVLFIPPGEGPFPAVLDLCTFMSEKRACLLANKGFVVLTVAVFNEKPHNVKEMHLDHFQEAVDYLLKHPKVGSKGVGLVSRSKAGDIALSLAAFVPGIEAVVWINGCSANIGLPLFYKNRQLLSTLSFDFSRVIHTESGACIIKNLLGNPLPEENKDCQIPIQKAKGHFLFVASGDDLHWDSKGYMDEMVERMQHYGKKNFEILLGGEPKAHIAAEVDLWKRIQEFLKSHVSCDREEITSKL